MRNNLLMDQDQVNVQGQAARPVVLPDIFHQAPPPGDNIVNVMQNGQVVRLSRPADPWCTMGSGERGVYYTRPPVYELLTGANRPDRLIEMCCFYSDDRDAERQMKRFVNSFKEKVPADQRALFDDDGFWFSEEDTTFVFRCVTPNTTNSFRFDFDRGTLDYHIAFLCAPSEKECSKLKDFHAEITTRNSGANFLVKRAVEKESLFWINFDSGGSRSWLDTRKLKSDARGKNIQMLKPDSLQRLCGNIKDMVDPQRSARSCVVL